MKKILLLLISFLFLLILVNGVSAQLVYSTDFEDVYKVDAGGPGYYLGHYGHSTPGRTPPSHNFYFGDTDGAGWWVEGLERNTSGFTCHSGTRCVGMEIAAGSHSFPRAEFNIMNLNTLIGSEEGKELYVSAWIFHPTDFNIYPRNDPNRTSGWQSIGDAFMHSGTDTPYVAFTLNPSGTTDFLWYFGYRESNATDGYHMLNVINPYTQYLHLGEWYHLEYYVYRSSTNGIVRYWINDQLLAQATGINTRNPDSDWFTTPIKIYYDNRDTNHYKAIWIDDLEIYNGMPTEVPTYNFSGRLVDKNNNPVDTNIIVYQNGTNTVINSAQTNSSGHYSMSIPNGTYDIQFNLTNFFIPDYSIKLNSINITSDTNNLIQLITGNQSGNKVSIVLDINNSQGIEIYSTSTPSAVKKNSTSMRNVSSLSELRNNTWFYSSSERSLYILATLSNPLTDGLPLADYYVVASDSNYYAINDSNQQTFLTDTNASNLINKVFNMITAGQTVAFSGNFVIDSTITVKVNNTLLDFSQATLNLVANTTLLVIRGSNVIVLGGHWIGENNPNSTAEIAGIELLDGTNVTINGAEMQDFLYSSCILPGWGSSYDIIKNCVLHDSSQAINLENGGHNVIQNCTLYNTVDSPIFVSTATPYNNITDCDFSNWDGSGHGIYIDGGYGGLGGNILSGCNFHDDPDRDAISDKTKNNKFYNNTFTNLLTGFSIHSQYNTSEANDNEIYNNSFANITFGIALGDSGIPAQQDNPQPTLRNKIHDNTFTNVTNVFLLNGFNNGLWNISVNTTIYYNTFVSCPYIFPTGYNTGSPAKVMNTVIAYNNFGKTVSSNEVTAVEAFNNTMIYNNTRMADFNVPSNKTIPPPPSPP